MGIGFSPVTSNINKQLYKQILFYNRFSTLTVFKLYRIELGFT